MNEEFKGELLGFSFNNAHSSELGIVRIIQGNRINDSAPSHKDIVVDIPGAIGSYYYGTIINKKDIVINYAFDNISEEQLLRIKTIFSDKLPHKLIFDEEPDAYYMARVSGSAQLKHLCFLEKDKRVYKGEGSLTFTCDYPFKIKETNKIIAPTITYDSFDVYIDQGTTKNIMKITSQENSEGFTFVYSVKNDCRFTTNLKAHQNIIIDFNNKIISSNIPSAQLKFNRWEELIPGSTQKFYFYLKSGRQKEIKIEFLQSNQNIIE